MSRSNPLLVLRDTAACAQALCRERHWLAGNGARFALAAMPA